MRFWLVFPIAIFMLSPLWPGRFGSRAGLGDGIAEGGAPIPPAYAEGGAPIPPAYAEGGAPIPPN